MRLAGLYSAPATVSDEPALIRNNQASEPPKALNLPLRPSVNIVK